MALGTMRHTKLPFDGDPIFYIIGLSHFFSRNFKWGNILEVGNTVIDLMC